jgi:PleD family two-component response regulator
MELRLVPAKDRRAAADRRSTPRGGRRAWDRPGRSPRVLVADGYDGVRVPCVRFLDVHGFDAVGAATAGQALWALDEVRPAAVLSGFENADARALYDRLLRDAALQSIPIIVLAADANMPLPSPRARVLTKPFALGGLLKELRDALRYANRC